MIRRPPRSTLDRSSAASDVYKRQPLSEAGRAAVQHGREWSETGTLAGVPVLVAAVPALSLIHISEPTRPY